MDPDGAGPVIVAFFDETRMFSSGRLSAYDDDGGNDLLPIIIITPKYLVKIIYFCLNSINMFIFISSK